MSFYNCSTSNPCADNYCCAASGLCTLSGDGCDADAGCQHACHAIPNASTCSTFTSPMFPNISATHSIALAPGLVPTRPSTCVPGQLAMHALTPCALVAAMGGAGECKYCLYYYDRVREAAEMYDMAAADCTGGRTGPLRYAQYLAQLRHETGSLATLHQPLDNGAGSLHMIPRQWVTAIDSVPRLKDAWAKESEPGRRFHGISRKMMVEIENNKTLERYVGLWLQNPEVAFVYGGWWYPYGAAILEEPECGDLRKQADVGRGVWDKQRNDSTGFWEVSRCIFGDLYDDWGLQDRIKAWDATYAVVKGWGGVEGVDGALGAGAIVGIVLGGVMFVGVVVVFVRRLVGSDPASKDDAEAAK